MEVSIINNIEIDGLRYRAIIGVLDEEERAANNAHLYYAFGLGNDPLHSYFFQPWFDGDLNYYGEKMDGAGVGNNKNTGAVSTNTLVIGCLVLSAICSKYNQSRSYVERTLQGGVMGEKEYFDGLKKRTGLAFMQDDRFTEVLEELGYQTTVGVY